MIKYVACEKNGLIISPGKDFNINDFDKSKYKDYDNIMLIGGINTLASDYKLWVKLIEDDKFHYIVDRNDLLRIYHLTEQYKFNDEFKFLSSRPTSIVASFPSQISYMVMSGGVPTQYKSHNDFTYEACFVDTFGNEPWHTYYNGRFGKIISNFPNNDCETPAIFNHSINLNNINNLTYTQRINSFGLQDTKLISEM